MDCDVLLMQLGSENYEMLTQFCEEVPWKSTTYNAEQWEYTRAYPKVSELSR